MISKNTQNYNIYENNQIKIKRKTKSSSLEHIFSSKEENSKTPECNEVEDDSCIIYINDSEEMKAINLDEENDNNIFKKLKKYRSKKKNQISSQCWYLIYKNLNSEKNDIIKSLQNCTDLPEIKEYIIVQIQSDIHLFLKFDLIFNFTKKINDSIFKYENTIPLIKPCKYWTEIEEFLKMDEKNFVTNIKKEKLEMARKNKIILNSDIITLVDEGVIDIKDMQEYIGAKRIYKEIQGKFQNINRFI